MLSKELFPHPVSCGIFPLSELSPLPQGTCLERYFFRTLLVAASFPLIEWVTTADVACGRTRLHPRRAVILLPNPNYICAFVYKGQMSRHISGENLRAKQTEENKHLETDKAKQASVSGFHRINFPSEAKSTVNVFLQLLFLSLIIRAIKPAKQKSDQLLYYSYSRVCKLFSTIYSFYEILTKDFFCGGCDTKEVHPCIQLLLPGRGSISCVF
jgi:hypothetical protein